MTPGRVGMLVILLALGALCALPVPGWAGETKTATPYETVKVTTESMTFPVVHKPSGSRGRREGTWYPTGDATTKDETVEVVKLDNGLVEAWVVPAWGARLIRAIDKTTGVDYFWWTGAGKDHLGWDAPGGVKPSFPFFEHGTHLRQPAGYRIVQHEDGSATVAMDTRFTHYNDERDEHRYGRYGDEYLNVMITLHPKSTRVDWTQRKENPNPLARGDRFWNDTLFPIHRITKDGFKTQNNPEYKKAVQAMKKKGIKVNKKTKVVDDKGKEVPKKIEVPTQVEDREAMREKTKFIYPMSWVVDHGPTTVHTSPHWSNLENWNISHFGILPEYGFCGAFDTVNDRCHLRIFDTEPEKGNACKLYSAYWPEFCEFWGGNGIVFEKPGNLRPAYVPVEFTHRFYLTQGIGEVDFANDDVAVAVEAKAFKLITPYAAEAEVTDATGAVCAKGPVGPHTILAGEFDGKELTVKLDGKAVMKEGFPLDRPKPEKETKVPPRIQKAYDELTAKDPYDLEKECLATNHQPGNHVRAIQAAEKVQDAKDPIRAMSLARAAYRWGALDEAKRVCDLVDNAEADLLRGLIAWEKGEKADFGRADWRADYMRALQAIQAGDKAKAVTLVESYLKHAPTAFRPRLAKAYWSGDKVAAQALAQENPGSPEAQLVLEMLGVEGAKAEKEKLLKGNLGAKALVTAFGEELNGGQWRHVPRFKVAKQAEK